MGEYIGNNNANTITPTRVSGGVSRNPAGSFPSDAVDTLRGRGGNDILDGGGGADNVSGGAGNDRITLGLDVTFTGSRDVVLDTGVTRTISLTDASGTADTVDGGGGIDGLVLNRGTGTGFILDAFNFPPTLSGVERIIGTDGVDLIALPLAYGSAEGGAVEIAGRGGDDVLIGSDSTMDDILGGDGDDLLAGLNGEDELSGGAGIDILLGGDGNDILDGGPGGNAGPNGDVLDGGGRQ